LILEAQTAPIRFAERAAQVKRMLDGRLRRARQNQFAVYTNSKLGINLKLENGLV
jgi:hypothetical protein